MWKQHTQRDKKYMCVMTADIQLDLIILAYLGLQVHAFVPSGRVVINDNYLLSY